MKNFGHCLSKACLNSRPNPAGGLLYQLRNYGLVGITTNFIAYVIYLLLTYCDIDPKVAMTLLYGVGAVLGFVGNKRITFQHRGNSLGASMRYILAQLAGYFLNLVLLMLFVDWLGLSHEGVQAAAILIVAGFLFVLYRSFVFAEPTVESESTKP